MALSYHVDYWDYLGWRDTLGGAEFSQRQYDYAKSRGDKNVYTPQMIINGGKHFVGSQTSTRFPSAIADGAEPKSATDWVDMAMSDNATDVTINIAERASRRRKRPCGSWRSRHSVSVEIKKGENAGSTIDYHNVVRKMVPAGMWHGEAAKIVLPKGERSSAGLQGLGGAAAGRQGGPSSVLHRGCCKRPCASGKWTPSSVCLTILISCISDG